MEVLGISTTFGNNNLDIVYPNTISFMKILDIPEILVYKGSEDSMKIIKPQSFSGYGK